VKVSLVQPLHAEHRVVKTGNGGIFKPAQLTMPFIAACTPPEFEVEIHDEIVAPLDLDKIDGEVVGITAVTPFAPRAYALAKELRARGQKVVMGGPHASALPEEAARHVDAVVVGEGDVLWPQALRDFQRGALRSIYRNERPVPLENLPRPRWDLTNPRSYVVPQVVQATRGCPFTCEFCSLRTVFPGYRTRPVRDVIREVEQIPYKDVVFWDDNIIGSTTWAKEFFRELKPLGKRWYSQATITIARNKELVRLAGASGCGGLFVGLESFSAASLKETNKAFNRVERYRQDVRLLADNGICTMSGLIFGFDEDTTSVFRETLDGAIEIGLTDIAASILTPYPGTPLFERMRRDGRLTTLDWSRYTSDEVVFTPVNLTVEQLMAGHNWVGQQFHSATNMVRRWWRTGFVNPRVFWLSNLANRRYFGSFPAVAEDPGVALPGPAPDVAAPGARRLPVVENQPMRSVR
jgi:radical SAM superfamily enzyme YgiQ (UPF0313 family)